LPSGYNRKESDNSCYEEPTRPVDNNACCCYWRCRVGSLIPGLSAGGILVREGTFWTF
jgi:hypothetical protein